MSAPFSLIPFSAVAKLRKDSRDDGKLSPAVPLLDEFIFCAGSPTEPAGSPYEPTLEEIQARAYEVYIQRGRIDGFDLEDWLQAEKELKENGNKKRGMRDS